MLLETVNHFSHSIEIHQDDDPSNPREDDNLGTMVCFHNRYNLGDTPHGYDFNNYDSWAGLKEAILNDNPKAIILPIYMYDHSGITINTTGFHCNWDSGQIGFIFISREKIREEYSAKNVSAKLRARVTTYLEGEVETYDQYLRGEIYGFVAKDEDGEEIDSCWGYYDKDHMVDEAKLNIVYHIQNKDLKNGQMKLDIPA
jgi:hypothetical protein